jgi:hypothetical protein
LPAGLNVAKVEVSRSAHRSDPAQDTRDFSDNNKLLRIRYPLAEVLSRLIAQPPF